MDFKKRILVAPLNWGLGHATRCMPIIKALIEHQYEPIIASDGAALVLLKKEFPTLICLELPSYDIQYPKYGFLMKWQLFKTIPKLLYAVKKEKKTVQNIIKTYHINGIISDNRFGVYSTNPQIPSVYITHQLQVFSGITTWLTTKLHRKTIKKHQECWIPDFENQPYLSGNLGHIKNSKLKLKYVGPLSRFIKFKTASLYDLMVLLSGPEPQRTLLEEKILSELKGYTGTVILIQGIVGTAQKITQQNNVIMYNFMQSHELEKAIQCSNIILSRSGYTTIMDLAILKKKAFFIPTPGQDEQLYLAKRLKNFQIAPYCKQHNFTLEKLQEVKSYKGFDMIEHKAAFHDLFSLFEGE
tara:strand:- start:3929 stop:4996 length:1068 start_codon:yes stop_codon:yes gene_type:complete